jgi:hypothetical protein
LRAEARDLSTEALLRSLRFLLTIWFEKESPVSQADRDHVAVLEAVAQLQPKLRQSTPRNIAVVSGVPEKAVRELLAAAKRDGLAEFIYSQRLLGPSGWTLTTGGEALIDSGAAPFQGPLRGDWNDAFGIA